MLYLLNLSTTIEVQMGEIPQDRILASTLYEKDRFQSFIMAEGREYARKLLMVAFGGCAAEKIYHEVLNDGEPWKCRYGTRDMAMISEILRAMCLPESDIDKVRKETCLSTLELLRRHESDLKNVAKMLSSGKQRMFYYSDISFAISDDED